MYDFNNTAHRQLERIGANQFNQLFFDRNTQRFNFAISGDKKDGEFVDSRYPTVQLLKQGYADAVKQGYEFGFEVYARDKFIQLVMDSRGIKGYTGTLPPEAPVKKLEQLKLQLLQQKLKLYQKMVKNLMLIRLVLKKMLKKYTK